MQEQGKIRHIGLSEVTPAEIEAAQKIVRLRLSRIDTVWPTGGMRRRCILRTAGHRLSAVVPDQCGKAAEAGQSVGADAGADRRAPLGFCRAAFAWHGCLQRSPVMLPIPGTSKVAHLEENVAAAELKLSAEEWAEIEAAAKS